VDDDKKVDGKKILVISKTLEKVERILKCPIDPKHVELSTSVTDAIGRLTDYSRYNGVFIAEEMLAEMIDKHRKLEAGQLLELLPQGIMFLDKEGKILWANKQISVIAQAEPLIGEYFYKTFQSLDFDGPYYSPLAVALATKSPIFSGINDFHGKSYQFHIVPMLNGSNGEVDAFIAVLEDVSTLRTINQKLQSLHDPDCDLVDLTPYELRNMNIEDRIELLKTNIIKTIGNILKIDVVEIRLLNHQTKELAPLLSMGISEEAANRRLFASTENNGVTGFVAKLGKSYSIEDTQDDPLFIASNHGAKSSFTVPLKFHEEVIGTLNVESPQPRAFSAVDELLIKLFARDIAVALHTLELLSAEKASTAAESVEAIHAEVALPIDQILNDAVSLVERYIGLKELAPDILEKIQRILKNARDIKLMIQKVGESMAPGTAQPTPPTTKRPQLVGKRILVVDDDLSVRQSAHKLLVHYGCIVETAEDGAHALMLARNDKYDLFIAGIKLPDMDGYQFMMKLVDLLHQSPPPYIMMAGFGYDNNHTLVKANQQGLQGTLFKPFRLDQLLNTVERVLALH